MNPAEHPLHGRPPRNAATDGFWQRLLDEATAPYRAAGRFAWHFARGKLGRDPVFRGMLERGDFNHGGRVVDIGCGQGLLVSLLQRCGALAEAGQWPASWPKAPVVTAYTGIELMPRDVQRATASVGGLELPGGDHPRFVCGDMRHTPLPACDLVVILDVLHYVDHAAQDALLARVRDAQMAAVEPDLHGDLVATGGIDLVGLPRRVGQARRAARVLVVVQDDLQVHRRDVHALPKKAWAARRR
jgi:SAM-dependent methyltransferase